MLRQRTLKSIVKATGVGLHSGVKVALVLRPAQPNTGVVFRRVDLTPPVDLKADPFGVGDTRLASCLEQDGVRVSTVEHLMSALAGLGVDNVYVDVDAAELPIMDGSAAPFVALIAGAGLMAQPAPRRRLKILKPVEVRDGRKLARLAPGEGFAIRVAIDFPAKAIGKQTIAFLLQPGAFARDVAFARTFGFAAEVEKLRSMGLARGGSLDNAIVVDGDTILNPDGLQVPDEFVRHKLLDVIGDLYLAGGPIEGVYDGDQTGHALNNRLLRALFADVTAFAWVEDAAPASQQSA